MLYKFALAVGGLTAVLFLLPTVGRTADPPKPTDLPLTRVVLFNAGVGYFQRDGQVEGNATVEMRFPEPDVNDLIKSLILEDKDGGTVRAVTYDGKQPLDITLKSFVIDLTVNPTVGQLLHQARGQKVSITDKIGGTVSGSIVGVELPQPLVGTDGKPVSDGEQVNLLTADGLESVPLAKAKKIKFLKPEVDADFRKALEVLAAARGDTKKTVQIGFDGAGKRKVRVGYVTEAPMWKATYRLTMNGDGAAAIQGWATVENTTEEDWANVKIGLVAGRPMAFEMDLYDPLYVPRPVVEPEVFASLRPPIYTGGGVGTAANPANVVNNDNNRAVPQMPGQPGFGGGGFGGNQMFQNGAQFGNLGGQFGFQAGFGLQGYNAGTGNYATPLQRPSARELLRNNRLSYSELVQRLDNGKGAKLNDINVNKPPGADLQRAGVMSAAAAVSLGDIFEYQIKDPVTLPRLKSALLPIVRDAVGADRVSIYNAGVLSRHPLLGLRLVNKTKLHLAQGPVTVYEGDTFAGDARIPDLAPNETRLVSYAIDLNTEVVPRAKDAKSAIEVASIKGRHLEVKEKHTAGLTYTVRNRGPKDRLVVIEHPVQRGWKLTPGTKPTDTARDVYRFELAVKTGAAGTLDVGEETVTPRQFDLLQADDATLAHYAATAAASPAVRTALKKILEMRAKQTRTKAELAAEEAALKAIGEDQTRIRANIERVPRESDAYKRYLKKFDEQETEIERRQARAKELTAQAAADDKAYREYAETLTAE